MFKKIFVKISYSFLWIILFSVVFYLVILLIVHLPPVQRYVLNKVEEQTKINLKITLQITSFSTNLFSYVNLVKIRVLSPTSVENSAFFEKVHIVLSPLSLLKKQINIPVIKADEGYIFAIRDKFGKFRVPLPSLPEKGKSSEKKNTWHVKLNSICASDVDLKYHDVDFEATITLKKLKGCTNVDSLESFFSAEKLIIHSPKWNEELDTFHISTKIKNSSLHISDFLLKNSSKKLTITGIFPFSSKGTFIADVYFHTDLEPFSRLLLPPDYQISGKIQSTLNISGAYNSPQIKIGMISPFLSFRNITIDTLNLFSIYLRRNDSLWVRVNISTSSSDVFLESSILLKDILSKPGIKSYDSYLNANVANIAELLKAFNINIPSLTGHGTFQIKATGLDFKNLPSEAKLIVKTQLSYQNITDSIRVALNLKDNKWYLNSAYGKSNRITGDGEIKLHDTFHGNISVDINNPSSIGRLFLKSPLSGSIGADAVFSDIFNDPKLIAHISSDTVNWKGLTITDLAGNLNYNKSWFIDSMNLYLNGDLGTLNIVKLPDLSGVIEASVNVNGFISNPFIRSKLTISNPSINNINAGLLSANLLFMDKKISWDSLRVKKDSLFIESTGFLDFLNPKIFFQTGILTTVNNSPCFYIDLSGDRFTDSLNADIRVNYARPGLLIPKLNNLPCSDGIIKLGVSVNNDLCIKRGTLFFDLSHYSTFLSEPYQSSGIVTYDAESLNGNVNILSIKDTYPSLNISNKIKLGSNCFKTFPSIINGSTVIVSFHNFNAGEILQSIVPDFFFHGYLDGTISTSFYNNSWNLSGTLHNFTDTFNYSTREISVSDLISDVSFSGTLNKPSISLSLFSPEINIGKTPVFNTTVKAVYSIENLNIDTLGCFFSNGGYLNIKGYFPLTTNNKFNSLVYYKLNKVPISILNNIVPVVVVKDGIISGDGKIDNISGDLNGDGKLLINNLQFYLFNCSGVAGPFESIVSFYDNSVIMDTLYGTWGDGQVYGNGNLSLHLNLIKDLNASVKLKQVRFNCFDAFQIGIDKASFSINKAKNNIHLTTGILLDDSKIEKFFTISGLVESFSDGNTGNIPSGPFFNNLTLDASIALNRNLLIETNLGQFLIDGAINVSGKAQKPRFSGNLQFVEGDLQYLENEFRINEGTLIQANSTEINPVIDITASSEVLDLSSAQEQQYIISLNVKGTLKKPQFITRSNPPLDQQQILSLLTLGGTQGGPGLATRTGQLLGSYAAGLGSQYIEDITGLGNLRLSGGFFGRNEQLSLSVSQNISRKIVLYYQTEISDPGNYAVKINYRLLPQLRLSADTDSKGNSALGIQFLYRR